MPVQARRQPTPLQPLFPPLSRTEHLWVGETPPSFSNSEDEGARFVTAARLRAPPAGSPAEWQRGSIDAGAVLPAH